MDHSSGEKPQSLFHSKWYQIEYAEKSKTIADPRNSLEFTADSEADAVRRFYEEFFSKSQYKVYTVARIR